MFASIRRYLTKRGLNADLLPSATDPCRGQVGHAQRGDRWIDWNAISDPSVPESLGRPLRFVSGLAVADLVHLAPSEEDRERVRRLEGGVEIEGRVIRFRRLTDTFVERLAQVAKPQEILVGATLREQSASPAAWIITGFKAVTMPLEQLAPSRDSGTAS